MEHKTCIKCGNIFPATKKFFNKDSQKKDGFCPYCKTCRQAKRKVDYKNSPNQVQHARERANKWFYENKDRAHKNRIKQYQQNREQNIIDSRNWRINNPERYTKSQKDYYTRTYPQRNKEQLMSYCRNRRARIKNCIGFHTGKDIENILIQQSGRCFYCGNPLYKYQVDHVIPIVLGGSNSPDNLVLACPHCNKSKGGRLPEDWIQNPIN